MSAVTYTGLKNNTYTPGRKIGQGGEGVVYDVREDIGLVVKVYNHELTTERVDKLTYMASISTPELNKFAAWPLDVIANSSGKICGFVMRKLVSFVPLHMLFSPMERKKLFPDKGYNYLVHVARNLAMAFYKIHQLGIIIGDVNEANILVNASGMIAMIDCDSFQVKNGKKYHFCEVGVPRYTPPELLEKGSFTNVVRTTNTDAFSLATLIFQLLFLGRAPFTGINQTRDEIDEEKAIRNREFAYSIKRANKKLQPAKNSLPLRRFPNGIIKLFHNAFEDVNHRPSAKDWVLELDALNKQFVQCESYKIHQYPQSMQDCPWCRFKNEAGIMYFLDEALYTPGQPLTDVDHFVNGFKPDRLEIKKLSANYAMGNLTALPIDKRFYNLKKYSRLSYVVVAVATLLMSFAIVWWAGPITAVLLVLLSNLIFPAQVTLKRELDDRKRRFETLKTKFKAIIRQHEKWPELDKYNNTVKRLSTLVSGFRSLPAELAALQNRIEEKYYNAQFKYFLFQFDIEKHNIPAFGAAKKKLLYDNGILNAADLNKLNAKKIAGIGPKNIQTLMDWQRQLGAGFAYQPDTDAINREVNTAGGQIALKKQKLETDIRAEYKTLQTLKAGIQTAQRNIERQHADAARKVYQAELDMLEFEKLISG